MSSATVTEESVCKIIASALPRSSAKGGVTPAMSLRTELGVDSFALMSIIFLLEDQTGIDAMSQMDKFISAEYVRDIVDLVLDS